MDLRTHIEALRTAGLLDKRASAEDIWNISAALLADERAALYTDVEGYAPIAGNLMNSRQKLALALSCTEETLLGEYCRRVSAPVAPAVTGDGPVHEVCLTGDDVDLCALPFMLQHEKDGGPYISSAVDVSRKPGGGHNLGMRRLMLLGKRTLCFNATSASDLRTGILDAKANRRPFELAFVIGMHPAYYMAALARTPAADELSLVSGLIGEPVPVVRCKTVDVLVPSNAELVIEGRLLIEENKVTEGPYGEILGAYGGPKQNYVMQVTVVTHRRDMLFETLTSGGDRIWNTDAVALSALRAELSIWSALCQAVPEPVNVYCPPAAGPGLSARASIRRRNPGDGKNALLAMLSCLSNVKYAFVTDADVDIFNDREIERAMAMRVLPGRDVMVLTGTRTMGPDPALAGCRPPVTGSKFGVDATLEPGLSSEYAVAPGPLDAPCASAAAPESELTDLLYNEIIKHAEGVTLNELRRLFPQYSWRSLVCALAALWDSGRIMKNAEGNYAGRTANGAMGL